MEVGEIQGMERVTDLITRSHYQMTDLGSDSGKSDPGSSKIENLDSVQIHKGLAYDVARHSPGPQRCLAALFAPAAASLRPQRARELSQQGHRCVALCTLSQGGQSDFGYSCTKSVIW